MNISNKFLAYLILPAIIVSLIGFTAPMEAHAATTITTCLGLRDMADDLDGDYVLGNDIDCSGIADWEPLGTFTGKLDGAGFEIQHLTILGFVNGNAFFGGLQDAKIYNLSFTDVNVQTNFIGGVIAPVSENTKLVNVHVEGFVASGALLSYTGSLIGEINSSQIYYSSADVTISGYRFLGGLVGSSNNNSTISNSWTTGTMSVNFLTDPSVAGGLVGMNTNSIITNSYSTMDISSATGQVGGLVGLNRYDSSIATSYATGLIDVPAGADLGGLVGIIDETPIVTDSYWDTESTTLGVSVGGTGQTTAQMKDEATFVGWDFDHIWDIDPGQYPTLIPYDMDPPVITLLQQLPGRVVAGQTPTFEFTVAGSGVLETLITDCGGTAEPLAEAINLDGNPIGVQITETESGETYACELSVRNLTEEVSNSLSIGPFTVVSGTVSGSSSKKKLATLPLPTQQTPALTPEQQIATPTMGVSSLLTRNLYFGLRGTDVKQLQQYLNNNGFKVAETGPGSPGNETELFGPLTRAAVIRYQKAKGISPSVGYVGPITRGLINGQ